MLCTASASEAPRSGFGIPSPAGVAATTISRERGTFTCTIRKAMSWLTTSRQLVISWLGVTVSCSDANCRSVWVSLVVGRRVWFIIQVHCEYKTKQKGAISASGRAFSGILRRVVPRPPLGRGGTFFRSPCVFTQLKTSQVQPTHNHTH